MAQSDSLATMGYAVGNVATSVALVLVNKKVFSGGFHFPLSLSFFHFCFTVIFYKLLLLCGAFSMPDYISASNVEKFKMAAAGVASIGFMNISLSLNSVGFYQVSNSHTLSPPPMQATKPTPTFQKQLLTTIKYYMAHAGH